MESIVQGMREGCYICGRTPTESHHIFEGTANRDLSEKYGLKVNLCAYHHRDSKGGAHFNEAVAQLLKAKGRESFEKVYPSLDFYSIFYGEGR